MSRPLFVFRPEPGWTVTVETARAMGLETLGQPLFRIEAVDWDGVEPQEFDGLLAGSSNVFRHGGAKLEKLRGLPVFAVGKATAAAAQQAGFLVARTGEDDLQGLLRQMEGRALRLLRLAGEAHVPIDPPEGMTVTKRVIYRAEPCQIDRATARSMQSGGVVALHSGLAASHLSEQCERLEIDRSKLVLATMGSRIAALAGSGWKSIHTAEAPTDSALLALARSLCQTSD